MISIAKMPTFHGPFKRPTPYTVFENHQKMHQKQSKRGPKDSKGFKRIQEDSKGFKRIQKDSKGFKRIQNDSN